MRAGWCVVVLLLAAGIAPAQSGSGSAPTPPPVKAPDYFGPSPTQPFNEKSVFGDAKSIFGSNGSPPPPAGPPVKDLPPTLVPDGSIPPPPPPPLWAGGIEFGITGSQGNSDVLAARLGALADRKTETNLFHLDFLYTLTRQDGRTNQNQALLNLRDEILFPGTRWSVFSATQVEYDQFRAYDFRVGSYVGVAYAWVKTDHTLFKTRAGAGAVREIATQAGGPPDRWVPEAVLGYDFNRRLTDRQSFVSNVDVYPNLSQLGQYRVRARAAYEIVIDPTHGMILRLGVQDRYDSSPGPARRNDLNYFTTLLFRF